MRTRKLFHDSQESLFQATRPIIMNGIGQFGTKNDMLSRAIFFDLPSISSQQRRTSNELESKFRIAAPRIFAGMVLALSDTLKNLPEVTGIEVSRMADFSHFGVAVERAMAWPDGGFLAAYSANRQALMELEGSDDPLFEAIRGLAADIGAGQSRTLSHDELQDDLPTRVSSTQRVGQKWIGSPKSLGKRLRTLSPQLEAHGILIDLNRGTKGRGVRIVVQPNADLPAPLQIRSRIVEEDED